MITLEEITKIREEKRKELDLRVNKQAVGSQKHILVCQGTGCTSSKSPEILENFKKLIKEKNIENVFVSGGAHINNLFLENNMVDEIIINYNPYVLTNGINLFNGNDVEKSLVLNKVVHEKEDIVQIWYKVKK